MRSARGAERTKMIQILPSGKPEGLPFALIGLDDEGRVWYGTFEYGGKTPDGGPAAVLWRRVEGDYR